MLSVFWTPHSRNNNENEVRSSLSKLDDVGLVSQIEEKVGSDLQFIRLNGAVVGGMAGILISLVKLYF